MANEDTAMEREIVNKLGSKKILSVCGSGARALALLNPSVEKLDCVDLSPQQISLAKMREALIKKLSLEDYIKFWGYAPCSPKDNKDFRKEIVFSLKGKPEDKELWEELHEKYEWESLLYKGKWESSFAGFGKITQALLGPKALEFFQFSDLDAQNEYLKKDFPWKRWNFLVRVIGNRATFNALLYKGDFIKKNVKESYFDYYSSAFGRLFSESLVRENFFLQLCMLGGIRFPEGNIVEAIDECYRDMKSSLEKGSPSYFQNDIVNQAQEGELYDYISISDVPSYFFGKLEKSFLQDMRPALAEGGVIVVRSYLRVPNADRSGYRDISDRFEKEIKAEKTQMYRVEVLQKI